MGEYSGQSGAPEAVTDGTGGEHAGLKQSEHAKLAGIDGLGVSKPR